MKRIMVDIETLATCPTAAMIGIAVAIRDDENPAETSARAWFIDPDLATGVRDGATIEWWQEEVPLTTRDLVWGGTQLPIDVLESVNQFVEMHLAGYKGELRVYADPAAFDFPILRHQYWLCNMDTPWSWRDERCLRSMKKALIDVGIDVPPVPNNMPHHPTHDCLEQFEQLNYVLHIMDHLGMPRLSVMVEGGGGA
jgi:hypothetical protein